MARRYGRWLAVLGVLVVALALSGCGNSKKGNGYGFAPPGHPTSMSIGTMSLR